MHDPAMQQQSSNHERWNVSLLLSLGLLAPKASYGFNDSSAIHRQSIQSNNELLLLTFTNFNVEKMNCREYEGQMISQVSVIVFTIEINGI